MSCTTTAFNHHVMNKMLWMSRQLRNYNDNVSIIQWANAIATLKNLLLPTPISHNQTNGESSQLLLSISSTSNCTHTIKPSPMPMSINQSSSSTILPSTFCSTSLPASAVKRRRVSPHPKKPHPAGQNFSSTEVSNIFTCNLRACSMSYDKGAAVKLTSPIKDKPKPLQDTRHITREDTDPHALPEDKEFQDELARLMSDAAGANMKWEEYLNANGERYQRCTRYFFCLPDDFVF